MSKLLDFQKEVGAITKDSFNPFFKSKYADINALLSVIKPSLNKFGLVITQPIVVIDGKNALATKLFDGDNIVSEGAIILPDNLDPPKMGSAITYYRRYSLQALLLLEAQDDDAEGTKKTDQKKEDIPAPKQLKSSDLLGEEAGKCKTAKDLADWWNTLSADEKTKAKLIKDARKKALLKVA